MWMLNTLQLINDELDDLEKEKRRKIKLAMEAAKKKKYAESKMGSKILNPHLYTKLKESKVWTNTDQERDALREFRQKLAGYTPRTNTQAAVISFSEMKGKRYLELNDKHEVEKYVQYSAYWHKKDVTVMTPSRDSIKMVYAFNKEMRCVITEYLGRIIITTMSSFENILRDIEGKELIYDRKRNKTEIVQNRGDISVDEESVDSLVNRLSGLL